MSLSKEQVLLLVNCMYATPRIGTFSAMSSYEGQTIREWIDSMNIHSPSFKSSNAFMNTREWLQTFGAVMREEVLLDMIILTTHVDNSPGGGGGQSAVFTDERGKEAVVAFKGTEGANEWADNFRGGNLTDTVQQKNALQWYRAVYAEFGLDAYDVTLSGHSKGGNKAKYITLMDESVKRCFSYDGQGFSDLFIHEYSGFILARQHKIENHNVDYDYVNLLLNDVGETFFYKRYNTDGNILENHCPNAFMKFSEDNSFVLVPNPAGQAKAMIAMDELLNAMLRAMPESQKNSTLNMLADIVNACFPLGADNTTDKLRNIVFSPDSASEIAYLAAYLVRYEQEKPEMARLVGEVLDKFGMGELMETVDKIDGLLNARIKTPFGTIMRFNSAVRLISGIGRVFRGTPDWLLSGVKGAVGVDLRNDEIRALFRIMRRMSFFLRTIKILDNGQDLKVEAGLPDKPRGEFFPG